jgi:hypothetical protein
MSVATLKETISIAGLSLELETVRTSGSHHGDDPSLAAAKAGSLTTRTDENTGVVTLGEGHGIITSDKVSVFWVGGKRYGMTATVSGNLVTVDLGAGDNLPAAVTAVNVVKQVSRDFYFNGDDVVMLAVGSKRRIHVDFQTAADASVYQVEIAAGEGYSFVLGRAANPFTGQIVAKILWSNGDAVNAVVPLIGTLLDND